MLATVGRSHMRASHLHIMVIAEGFRTLVTHIFVRGDELLECDTVFGVKESLIKDFERRPAGTPTPDGRGIDLEKVGRSLAEAVVASLSGRKPRLPPTSLSPHIIHRAST